VRQQASHRQGINFAFAGPLTPALSPSAGERENPSQRSLQSGSGPSASATVGKLLNAWERGRPARCLRKDRESTAMDHSTFSLQRHFGGRDARAPRRALMFRSTENVEEPSFRRRRRREAKTSWLKTGRPTHEPCSRRIAELINSAIRAGRRFMAPMCVQKLEVETSHEPGRNRWLTVCELLMHMHQKLVVGLHRFMASMRIQNRRSKLPMNLGFVAQVSNLPYRRLPTRQTSSKTQPRRVGNPRYGRLEICATVPHWVPPAFQAG